MISEVNPQKGKNVFEGQPKKLIGLMNAKSRDAVNVTVRKDHYSSTLN